MKLGEIYCARATGAAFAWKWRSADGKQESKRAFDYYFECLEDARRHGYTAEFSNTKVGPEIGPHERAK